MLAEFCCDMAWRGFEHSVHAGLPTAAGGPKPLDDIGIHAQRDLLLFCRQGQAMVRHRVGPIRGTGLRGIFGECDAAIGHGFERIPVGLTLSANGRATAKLCIHNGRPFVRKSNELRRRPHRVKGKFNGCDECMLAFAPFSQRLSRLRKQPALAGPMLIAQNSEFDQRQTRYAAKIFCICCDQRTVLQQCRSGNECIG